MQKMGVPCKQLHSYDYGGPYAGFQGAINFYAEIDRMVNAQVWSYVRAPWDTADGEDSAEHTDEVSGSHESGRLSIPLVELCIPSFAAKQRNGTVRISARNQLAGVVRKVTNGPINSEVVIQLADGLDLVAVVTRESAREPRSYRKANRSTRL